MIWKHALEEPFTDGEIVHVLRKAIRSIRVNSDLEARDVVQRYILSPTGVFIHVNTNREKAVAWCFGNLPVDEQERLLDDAFAAEAF